MTWDAAEAAARELIEDGHLFDALRKLDGVLSASDVPPSAVELCAALMLYAGRFEELRPEYLGAWGWALPLLIERRDRIGKGDLPVFATAIPKHLQHRLKAVRAAHAGDSERALEYLDRAEESAPEWAGTLDGQEFEQLRDADDRFAAGVELFHAELGWGLVPWEEVATLRLGGRENLLDHFIVPAKLERVLGGVQDVLLPAIYPGHERAEDETLALGWETDQDDSTGLVTCVGRRVFWVGDDESGLWDFDELVIRHKPERRIKLFG